MNIRESLVMSSSRLAARTVPLQSLCIYCIFVVIINLSADSPGAIN
jgi:hypothetical protein